MTLCEAALCELLFRALVLALLRLLFDVLLLVCEVDLVLVFDLLDFDLLLLWWRAA